MCELETAEGKVQSYQWSGTHDLYGNTDRIVIFLSRVEKSDR